MDERAFDAWTRRRFGAAAAGLTALVALGARDDDAAGKQKGKQKGKRKKQQHQGGKQQLCRRNGEKCNKAGNNCKKNYCLKGPFTITAAWTADTDHDTFLFVPSEDETTGPSPYIDYGCNQSSSTCEEEYPFACVDADETNAGDEELTIYKLLPGTYEYWVELYETLAGGVTVTLSAGNGRVVRTWQSPANPEDNERGWHVFDVDGKTGAVDSVDALDDAADSLPGGAHDPYTDVCP